MKTIFEALQERPEAALAAVAILAPVLLIPLNVDPYVATFTSAVTYLAYCIRSVWISRNEVKQKETEVEKIEAEGELALAKLLVEREFPKEFRGTAVRTAK
ncbi:MAG: hypothetical protein AB3N20_01010 [Rhizobiaceae bacterium]